MLKKQFRGEVRRAGRCQEVDTREVYRAGEGEREWRGVHGWGSRRGGRARGWLLGGVASGEATGAVEFQNYV